MTISFTCRGAVSREDIHQAVKQEELSVLKVYYKNDQIIQFKRDRLYTTEDFICEGLMFILSKQQDNRLYHDMCVLQPTSEECWGCAWGSPY